MTQYNRRQFLQTTGVVVGAGALAGCVGDDDTEQDTPTPTLTPEVTPTPEADAKEPEWSEDEEAYLISNLVELNWIRNDLEADYLLVDDIDASETVNWDDGDGWDPIGTAEFGTDFMEPFVGSFDGQEYVIENLFIDREDRGLVGLFGAVFRDSMVVKVGLENVNVTGGNPDQAKRYTGALIGANGGGTVTNSYSTGSVSGDNIVGGLVGGNGGGTVTNSYSTAEVSARKNAGGFIGRQDGSGGDGTVSNCYSTGDVTRRSGDKTNFGSFAGELDHVPGTIEYSYSVGSVYYEGDSDPAEKGFVGGTLELEDSPTYTSNFFDSEASNQTEGTGAEALTTAEMTDIDTFLDAEWNIEHTTEADPSDGYPFLSWQVGGSPTWYISK
jgi:hypothetical protein